MAAEVVPIVNCYCYGDDISSCEEKRRRLLTPGMQTSASMLVSIAIWYTGLIGYGSAIP